MENKKINLNDLLLQIRNLNKKYLIDDFSNETKKLFREMDIPEIYAEKIIQNPFDLLRSNITTSLETIDNNLFEKCTKDYKSIKKKYKYDSYIKEGHALRKKFLDQRKNYIFNSAKFLKFTPVGKVSALEKLNIDFAEQHFMAKWTDKLLKRIFPKTLTIEYEDLSGFVKTAEIQYHKNNFCETYSEAPLIDRLVGESVFDTFLLHSFYDVNLASYQYYPIKFVIKMRSKDYPSDVPI